MTEDIVEVVARAIAETYGAEFGRATQAHKNDCRNMALSALAAIRETHAIVPREPTEAMVRAGQEAYEPEWEYGLDDEDMGLAYTAMIAAAEGRE